MLKDYKAHILVVDDNPMNLQVIGGLLEDKGYELAIALSGKEALAYLEKEQTDLILLDIMMPGIDGYEVCGRLKRNPITKNIPVIFLTANSEPEQIARGFEAGAVDYVTKPFHSDELMARIHTHLDLSLSKRHILIINEALKETNMQLQEALEQLEIAAKTDPLTSLLNRRSITEIMENEMVRIKRNRKSFSLILADIDDFKRINDSFGHDCGDFVLQSISELLNTSTRAQDAVARWGGEEFLIFLPETELAGALRLSEELRSKAETTCITFKELDLSITLTFGVSVYQEESGLEAAIKMADISLYKGKEQGKNRVVASQGYRPG